jgi:rod shape-determining protein MreC
MKTKALVATLFALFLIIVMTKNDGKIIDLLLSLINPVKQTYTNVTKDIEDKSQSYVYQKESIQRLTKENKSLHKRLLEQEHYIQQVKDLYRRIPSLDRMPKRSVDIVQTISYVKLNSFSQVILTKPDDLNEDKDRLYGLIQGDVVAGVAKVRNSNLYGSLISYEKCRFSVFVGPKKAAGIAMGVNPKEMYIKFIPKWSEIKKGDEVVTSGLDTIFFANIPVGVVERVEVESSYKIAYIKVYADVLKPDYFYLIKDPSKTLTSKFDGVYISNSDTNNLEQNSTTRDGNKTIDSMNDPKILSIPSVLVNEPETISQTIEEEVSQEQIETPIEVVHKPIKRRGRRSRRPKVENLDIF